MRRTDLKDLGTLLPCVLLLSPGRILVLSFCSIAVRKINRFTSKQRTVWIKMATLWLCFPKPLLLCHWFWSCTFQTEGKATSVPSASAGEHLGQAECPDVLSAPLPAQPPRPTPRSKCWWQGQVVGAGPYLYRCRTTETDRVSERETCIGVQCGCRQSNSAAGWRGRQADGECHTELEPPSVTVTDTYALGFVCVISCSWVTRKQCCVYPSSVFFLL